MFEAKIIISLKPTVNNPEGLTIKSRLETLGFTKLDSVIRIDLEEENEAISQVEDMCSKLLANPIIEQYKFDITQI